MNSFSPIFSDDASLEDLSLRPGSYTAHRLRHGTPKHLHLTTRRCFIGPIPEGWLKSHRKDWYRHHLHINYSSRASTFSTTANISNLRQITGLDGPSTTARFGPSFPQPKDLDDPESADDDGPASPAVDATTEAPPAIPAPRSQAPHLLPPTDVGSTHAGSTTRPRSETPSGLVDLALAASTEVSETSTGHAVPTESPTPLQTLDSRSSLLHTSRETQEEEALGRESSPTPAPQGPTKAPPTAERAHPQVDIPSALDGASASRFAPDREPDPMSPGLVRFNLPEEGPQQKPHTGTGLSRARAAQAVKQFRRVRGANGEVVKVDKMLVRIDMTRQDVANDYDENAAMKTETRLVEKWREYVVVCRKVVEEDADFTLQFYKSRVIPATQRTSVRKRATHEILLSRRSAKLNFYSALDKTVVVSQGVEKRGTMIYLLRPRSSATSAEWYTFLRTAVGWTLPQELQIYVPDLALTLQLDDVFAQLEQRREETDRTDDVDVMLQTMKAEQAVAGDIIRRCLTMLDQNPEWADTALKWSREARIGLAWKRYDRLEWIHGAREQRMYGTLAMQRTHELELRPKRHYPTEVKTTTAPEHDGRDLVEPAPVEGFLIRLTSQRGRDQRFGRLFYKRLYFYTHDQYLCFCRPAKAVPPPPPKLPMLRQNQLPTTRQIVDKMPLIFAVAPYALQDGEIGWLRPGHPSPDRKAFDQDAFDEAERKVNLLLHAEGLVDLCDVVTARPVVRGSAPVDAHVEHGDEVDFNEEVRDSRRDDGVVGEFDDDRTLELVLKNGLVVRLEAYNDVTKTEWIQRLNQLIHYWTLRKKADMELFKTVRQQNLDRLHIDEGVESFLGQFGQKWEVSRSVASADLYNMCGVSICRAISISGVLFRKPRRYATFRRFNVILCHGHLLLFEHSVRTRTGKEVPYSHHDRHSVIDLKDCYVYSGLVTESDLLMQSQTFDSNHPGRHALPRIYPEDGWTSSDEDIMTCFVIWRSNRKSFFRADEDQDQDQDQGGRGHGHGHLPGGVDGSEEGEREGRRRRRLKQVSQLGATGRSVVFKTRSRAERDHWVLSIGLEIERLQQSENFRVVSE
ncbi:MAG: hypothetical protein M1838_006282 [Thelocarpon superellum]|nr:MAG: hypothetical protein M1838_006282 [Thelocarpon superellum]